jgi:hypothetical protein
MTVMPRPAWRIGASARRVHRASLSDASRPMPCPGAACRPFVPVSSPLSASARDPMPSLRPVPLMATHSGTKLTLAAPPAASARWTVRHGCLYRAMEHEVGLPTRDRDVGPPGGSGGHGGQGGHRGAGVLRPPRRLAHQPSPTSLVPSQTSPGSPTSLPSNGLSRVDGSHLSTNNRVLRTLLLIAARDHGHPRSRRDVGQRYALSALVTELSPLALLYAQMPLAFLCPQ